MAGWCLLALKRAPAISEKNGSGTVGRVGAQTWSMSQLPRWKWKSGNSTATDTPNSFPSSRERLHEIKHDGFRVIARKNGRCVGLYSRPGNDLTHRFPLIVETLVRLRSRSCIIDGEAVGRDDTGVALFNLVRYRRHDESIFLYAFDLIELNGDDLRRDPLRAARPRWQ